MSQATNKKRSKQPLLIAVVILLAITLWMASGLLGGNDTDKNPEHLATPSSSGQETALVKVKTLRSNAKEIVHSATVSARTEASRLVNIRAETSGKIVEIIAERGAKIEAGDIIAKLQTGDRRARVIRAEALLKQRELQYAAAKRTHKLGHVTDVDLAVAKANLAAAQADMTQARDDLAHATITAPLSGTLETRPIEIGDYLGVGNEVASIVQNDPFIVRGFVSEDVIGKLKNGQAANAQLVDGRSLQGKLRYVATRANEQTRTFLVELEISAPEEPVVAGASAVLILPLKQIKTHQLKPATLTLDENGEFGIKTVNSENRVEFFKADIIQNRDGSVWLAGLPDELNVIIAGQGFVSNGDEVLTEASESPANNTVSAQ